MTAGFTLAKKERLSSKTALSALVSDGRYGRENCLKFCYKPGNGVEYNRIVVSVPKRHFRRAVKRNLLKRRIREAYRTNKNLLPLRCSEVCPEGVGTDILFIYNTAEIMPQAAITSAVQSALSAIAANVNADGR